MGITQHTRSVATIQMLANLLLLRGNIGRPGAGPCPVRGHSNVQGDRTMGIYEQPSPAFLDRLGAVFDFAPPRAHGYDTIAAIEAMHDGRAQGVLRDGRQLRRGHARHRAHVTRRCAAASSPCTSAPSSTARTWCTAAQALILPCLGRTEIDLQAAGPQAVTVEDSMSMVHLSSGMNPPASEQLLSEPAIVARLAAATLPHSRTPWLWLVEDYDRIRDRIAQVIDGFEDFNARVRAAGGFHLHHPGRERVFPTASGKASFYVAPAGGTRRACRRTRRCTLMTVRSHDQYNTTVYGLDDRYRGVHGLRRVCFISHADLQRLGLHDGEHGRHHLGLATTASARVQRLPPGRVRHPAAAAWPATSRRPTRWCRWTTMPNARARRRRSRSRCACSAEHGNGMSEDAALALLQLLRAGRRPVDPPRRQAAGAGPERTAAPAVALGDDPRFDGLDLVEQRADGERTLLWLTAQGPAAVRGRA